MTGIVIVTHGEMATGLMDSLSLIMGEQEDYQTLGLKHGDDIGEFGEKIQSYRDLQRINRRKPIPHHLCPVHK
jgi:mannose/fructose-specific phosphotransferase system component IIA